MGVVKKNAILQVDYTTYVLRQRGLGREQAQMQADRARLRPILMTTPPSSPACCRWRWQGDGSARAPRWPPRWWAAALCLIVTLLMTPVIYSSFDDLRGLRSSRGSGSRGGGPLLAGRVAWGKAARRSRPALSPGPLPPPARRP